MKQEKHLIFNTQEDHNQIAEKQRQRENLEKHQFAGGWAEILPIEEQGYKLQQTSHQKACQWEPGGVKYLIKTNHHHKILHPVKLSF